MRLGVGAVGVGMASGGAGGGRGRSEHARSAWQRHTKDQRGDEV